MKRITFLPFLLLLITILVGSCKEDNYADWKILNEKWLENFKDNHTANNGYIQTESGLYYKVIHQGEIANKPSLAGYNGYGSFITAKYVGKLIDGTAFDSGVYESYLTNAISGWQEVLLKMNVGSKIILYVPASLGYADAGSGKIPPYSVLYFEIELLDSKNQL